MPMKILFVGGTGQISYPCVERAVAQGHHVSVYNRGLRGDLLPAGVTSIVGDLAAPTYADLAKANYDVVCQFIAFTPDQVARDIDVFAGHCGQYIFISSASVYEKPARHYVITEQTPAINPYWRYSQNKIACEALLKNAENLAWTIVRPSHTVRTGLPIMMGDSDVMARRMLDGEPTIVAGDGHTPWTLTRSVDLAVPFVGLFGKPAALNEVFQLITSDRAHIWDDIQKAIARLLGVEAKIVHVPTDTLVRYNPDWVGPSSATRLGRRSLTIQRSKAWRATSAAPKALRKFWRNRSCISSNGWPRAVHQRAILIIWSIGFARSRALSARPVC